jgi:hypothetical protein
MSADNTAGTEQVAIFACRQKTVSSRNRDNPIVAE